MSQSDTGENSEKADDGQELSRAPIVAWAIIRTDNHIHSEPINAPLTPPDGDTPFPAGGIELHEDEELVDIITDTTGGFEIFTDIDEDYTRIGQSYEGASNPDFQEIVDNLQS